MNGNIKGFLASISTSPDKTAAPLLLCVRSGSHQTSREFGDHNLLIVSQILFVSKSPEMKFKYYLPLPSFIEAQNY